MAYQPIENYGVIGDLDTVALVGMNASIDFLCAPYFDSPSIFARLLDDDRGGCFSIEPQLTNVRQKQVYLPDTNVLLTRFLAEEGVAEVSDFMAIDVRHHAHTIVRRVKTVRGTIRYRMICAPRFDYARAEHRVEAKDHEVLFVSRGQDGLAFRLSGCVPIQVSGRDAVAELTLGPGENAWFVFEQARPGHPTHATAHFVSESFKETVSFWRRWVGLSSYRGRWREMVNRSALVLKLITSQQHGSLVAAPTFGLPERIGGRRNWDYRYTWIRDSAFTIYALIRIGHTEEATAFMRWIERRLQELEPDGALQVMYGIDGRHRLDEETLPHFEGYCGSSPVRIGNDAYKQLQLDIYGELMDAVYLSNKFCEPISYDLWKQLIRVIDWVCTHWRQPDEGIWEVRGGRREFLHSRLMCWVAVDRAIRLAQKRSFPAPFDRWARVRDEIYTQIFDEFWDQERQAFVQYRGSGALDAAALLMPLLRFIAPTDPRWLSTLEAIDRELAVDSLLKRYVVGTAAADGFCDDEGTFNMCTFWYVECLSRAGHVQKARLMFEKMLGYANHLGLYAEQLGPRAEHLGNFPQAFTHLALISAAYNLDLQLATKR